MLDYLRLFLQLVFLISMMYTLLDCKEKLKKNRYVILAAVTGRVRISETPAWETGE